MPATRPTRGKGRAVRQPAMGQPKHEERVEERLKPEPCEDALAQLRAKLPSLAAKATRSPLSAIKLFCLDCADSRAEVVACPSGGSACEGSPCPLWPFRMGKRPGGRVMTDEQRQAASDRARAMQAARVGKAAEEVEDEEVEDEDEAAEAAEDGAEDAVAQDPAAWTQVRRFPEQ